METHFEITYFDRNNREQSTSTRQPEWRNSTGEWQNPDLGLSFAVICQKERLGTRLAVPAESIRENSGNRFKTMTVLLPAAAGHEGEDGNLVLPLDNGMLCQTCGKSEREYHFSVFSEREWDIFWCNMAFYGRYAAGKGRAVAIENGKFDCELRLRTNFGPEHEYRIDPVFLLREWPEEQLLSGGIALFFADLPATGYADLAAWFRGYNREIRKLPTLAEKCRENPALAYSARALTVRCRMAVKPLPCKIFEQTAENQPPAHVYMNYDRVTAIARKYAELGVGPAEFCLVGWNYGGHDGAFPQLFPVCAAVGSEDELRRAGEAVQELGYHFSLHDNYYDAYTLAENFDFDDVCASDEPYHMPVHGGGILGGGRAYRICGERAEKYAAANLAEVKKRFPRLSGAYFVDVLSLIAMAKCADPRHPQSRSDNARSYKKILRMLQQKFGVSMSEGGRDWSLPELDRAYMLANKPGNENVYEYTDEGIPLYQLIYHGQLIYNTFRSGINSWPGSFDYLWNLAVGGLPMVYYHHLFNPDWSAGNGCKLDLGTTPEELEADTPLIKRISDDVTRVAPLQLIPIEKFVRRSAELTETDFADGSKLYANFSATPVCVDGITVPAGDFIVCPGAMPQ